ncbi:MAG: RnfABCDGE type electron transport complex subunit D [Spirochaetales bacterium]|nr:RnfABCDGE type electron transport complex subunit D [Spirochaetales bacterium]
METRELLISTSSPHLREGSRTSAIMWFVCLALFPASVWGVVVFGWYSLIVLVVSIFTALLTEFVITAIKKKMTLFDGSAFLTGLLIGMNMPPSIPVYIPVFATIFAVAIVKHAFGGLGRNWMNPALAGRVFAMFSWSKSMATWSLPSTLASVPGADAVSGASPLGYIKAGLLGLSVQADSPAQLSDALGSIGGPMNYLASKNFPVSSFDLGASGWLKSVLNIDIGRGYIDLFVGNVAGSIGEVSALLLLAGALFLFIKKIISWHIPAAYLGTFAFLTWLLGGFQFSLGLFQGDVLFHLFAGGLMLGVFFMATDYVTTPLTPKGMLIFGAGAGLLTFLIRFYGGLPEGVSLAIIIMNMCVPLIDRFTKPKIFGSMKKIKKGAEA